MLIKGIKNLSILDYVEAYKDLENFCIENVGPLIIGEFGDPSCPSISDLDVFICLKDENFKQQKDAILNYINEREIRTYLFFHDPLIVSEEMLRLLSNFHSLYNFEISYNPQNIKITKTTKEAENLLNIIWTSFMLVTGTSVLINKKYTTRDKLLVLKNICQSIHNIDPSSDALEFSVNLRNQVLRGNLTNQDVNDSFVKKLNELFTKTNEIKIENLKKINNRQKYKIGKNRFIIASKSNSFSISEDGFNIYLNQVFLDFYKQFYYKKTNNSIIKNYISNAQRLNRITKKYDTDFPFISPFSFQFFRTDNKFKIKKIIYSLS
jgi:hypothetical protein